MTGAYDHVTDDLTREVLERGEVANSEDIYRVLDWANQCLQADQENPEVSSEVYRARCLALSAAESFWQLPYIRGTIENLRLFWSV